MLTVTFDNNYLKNLKEDEHIFWHPVFLLVFLSNINPVLGKTNLAQIAEFLDFPTEVNNLNVVKIIGDAKEGMEYHLLVEGWQIIEDRYQVITQRQSLRISLLTEPKKIASSIHQYPDLKETRVLGETAIELHQIQYSVLEHNLMRIVFERRKPNANPDPLKKSEMQIEPLSKLSYATYLDAAEYQFWNESFVKYILKEALNNLLQTGDHHFPKDTCQLEISKIFKDPRRNAPISVDYILEVFPWIEEIDEDGDCDLRLNDEHPYGIVVNVAHKDLFFKDRRLDTELDPNITLKGITDFTSKKYEDYIKNKTEHPKLKYKNNQKKRKLNEKPEVEMKLVAESLVKAISSTSPELDTHQHTSLMSNKNEEEEKPDLSTAIKPILNQ